MSHNISQFSKPKQEANGCFQEKNKKKNFLLVYGVNFTQGLFVGYFKNFGVWPKKMANSDTEFTAVDGALRSVMANKIRGGMASKKKEKNVQKNAKKVHHKNFECTEKIAE